MEREVEAVEMRHRAMHERDQTGSPSGFTCPECHGAL
jgi:hypothetical protein